MKQIAVVLLLVITACSSQIASPLASPVGEIIVSNTTQLTSAMSTATSGMEIVMRGGTYEAPATGWQFSNGGVTITNYPGEIATLSSMNKKDGNYIIKCAQTSPAVNDVKIIGTDVGGQKGIVMTGEHLGISPAIVAYQCDGWEVAGNTQPSQFINNLAWGNHANFRIGQFTTVFTGNSTVAPETLTPTATVTPTITKTPSPTMTRIATMTPTLTSTRTPITPTPQCMIVQGGGLVCYFP